MLLIMSHLNAVCFFLFFRRVRSYQNWSYILLSCTRLYISMLKNRFGSSKFCYSQVLKLRHTTLFPLTKSKSFVNEIQKVNDRNCVCTGIILIILLLARHLKTTKTLSFQKNSSFLLYFKFLNLLFLARHGVIYCTYEH